MTEISNSMWIVTGLAVFLACVLIGYLLHKAEHILQLRRNIERSEPRDTQSNYEYWDD
jgi:hypothetical protein